VEGAGFVEELEKEWRCLLPIYLGTWWARQLKGHCSRGDARECEVSEFSGCSLYFLLY
jgi:hypothetical protein